MIIKKQAKEMDNKRIRVGFIGLNPKGSWASTSHIPALKSLPDDFEIVGVANSTFESSKAAAETLGLPLAFESPQKLVQSPEIDLVVVAVKVPHHFELVKLALEAGKHVYCEHPLGNGLEETKKLAEIAEEKGVVAVVGTQFVVAPEIQYLKRLIAEGYLGKVLSTTLVGSGGYLWTDTISENYSYVIDKANGATLLTIPLGHTLAGFTEVLGDFEEISAMLLSNYNSVKIVETGETKPKTAEDQVLIIGKLNSGVAVSIHYRAGLSRGTNFFWEINGTEGDIQIKGASGNPQNVPLIILGAKGQEKELHYLLPPVELTEGLPETASIRNIAILYKTISQDIINKTHLAPNFQKTVKLHEFFHKVKAANK